MPQVSGEVVREGQSRRTSPESWGSALEREPLEAHWQANGARGLAGAGRAGPGLDNRQLVLVAAEVEKGVRARGYPTGLCALARIAEVIEATTGMSFHPFHPGGVGRVPHQMGWSRQPPARRNPRLSTPRAGI